MELFDTILGGVVGLILCAIGAAYALGRNPTPTSRSGGSAQHKQATDPARAAEEQDLGRGIGVVLLLLGLILVLVALLGLSMASMPAIASPEDPGLM